MLAKESSENYLETILIEQNKRGSVRSIDICSALGVTKPTVSVTMKKLREEGCIEIDSDGFITLTESGRAVAERMYERHNLLASALMALGASEEHAIQHACKIEHDLCDECFELIKRHFEEHSKTGDKE